MPSIAYEKVLSLPLQQIHDFNGKKISVRLEHLNNYIAMLIGDCVTLYIYSHSNNLYLYKLQAKKKGIYPDMDKGLGTLLLEFIIYYSRDILGASCINLSDTSYVYYEGQKLDLALHSLMLYHKTWYGRFGFVPEREDQIQLLYHTSLGYLLINDLSEELKKQIHKAVPVTTQKTITEIVSELFHMRHPDYVTILNGIAVELHMKKDPTHLLGHVYHLWTLKL